MTISTFWCYFLYKLRLLRHTKVFIWWKFENGKSKGVEFRIKIRIIISLFDIVLIIVSVLIQISPYNVRKFWSGWPISLYQNSWLFMLIKWDSNLVYPILIRLSISLFFSRCVNTLYPTHQQWRYHLLPQKRFSSFWYSFQVQQLNWKTSNWQLGLKYSYH